MLKLRRKPCFSFFISLIIACSLPQILYAQTASGAVSIVYSVGGDFILTRSDGSRNIYNSTSISQNVILLQNADYIQTDSGAFVELLINPGETSIIIAENTSLVFENTGGPGGPNVISLVYGRVRVSQQRASLTTVVKAGQSITEIQNGSVNFDLVVPSESTDTRLTFYATALSGSAVFIPSAASPENARIRIKRHETVIFYPNESKIDRQPMNKEIVTYWAVMTGTRNANGHIIEPPDVDRLVSPFDEPDYKYSGRAAYLKTRFLIAGMITMAAGAALQSVVHFTPDIWQDDMGETVFYAGYAPLGLGIFMLLAAYFY
jgi:hypothetical protein